MQETSINELASVQAAKYVCELWDNYQIATMTRRSKLIDWYKQYRGTPNRRNYNGRANVFVPETLQAVESIVSQEVHAIFAEPKYLMLLGREPTDEPQATLLENAMFYYLDKMNWKSKFIMSDRQKVKYGTCFVETFWDSEEGYVPRRQGDSGIPKVTIERVKDHPNIRYIDEMDICLELGKPDIADMKYVIIRNRCDWDYVQAKKRSGVYSAEQVGKIDRAATSRNSNYLASKEQRVQAGGVNMSSLDIKDYEILKYWGKVPRWWVDEEVQNNIESDEATEMVPGVIEVVNPKGPTLRLQRNPFWHQEIPVAMAKHIGVDDESHGMGACEIVESLQMELNDKRNQLLDHATDQLMPPLIENRGAGIQEIRWEPQFRIKSNLPGEQALKPLYPGGNPNEVVMMEERVKADIKSGPGATAPIQGLQSGKESTAFEVSTLQSRGSGRIDVSTMDMGSQFLKRIYRQVYKMIQQFTDQETMIRILGKDGVKWQKLTPEDVALDADIIPKIPTDVDNRIIVRNQMIQFLAQVAPFFPRINAYKLVRRIYELFGFDDVEEVVPKPSSEFDRRSLTTEEEMQVLFLGQKINVNLDDNHPAKLSALMEFMAQYESTMKPEAIEAFKDAIRQHIYYMQAMQQAAMQPQAQAMGAGVSGGKSNGSGPPGGATEVLRAATNNGSQGA